MKFSRILFLLFFALMATFSLSASGEQAESKNEAHSGFSPQKLIFHHINDAYEWHITTIGETHVAIPLPVIVYSKQTGLHAFMSGNFHHGEEAYQGFKIAHEGKNEGKVVEIQPDGSEVRPVDISITKNVTSLFISIVLLLVIFLSASKRYKENFARAPKGIQSWVEPIIIFVRDDVAKAAIPGKYMTYLPYLLTIFFFIFLNNLLGLIPIFPGGANLTGNIAITMVLALITFVITQFSSNKAYWTHIVNMPGVPWWLKFPIPLMPVIEIMGLFIKPFVLMIRLFANITAGHIVALAFYCLIFVFGEKNIFAGYGVSVVSVAFTVFMALIELLVAFIQAYVFTLLSAMYFGMAMESHEEHHE
ncbi:F0F1 ATP synthase subunit A [Parabacteroides sp. FAFU027]|uniref:F0F1 ATP synthase subunit A n=1 Tax=Parabacteroides sp. FAFU027 TaxID=2922715 RepID=UPI001FB032B4|nr:F0F1 ATP synthase subunit A [Parabacteroides sp. FAFU027]